MDYQDVVVNFTSNYTETTYVESQRYILHEIVFTIFCIVGLCADVAIIYTMLHFKRMHTVPNFYIATWAIVDVCSLIVTPSGYRIISVIEHAAISFNMMCILFQLGSVLHIAVIFCVLIILVDWCLAAYFRSVSEKIRKYYKFVLGSVCVFILVMGSVYPSFCFSHSYYGFVPTLTLFFSFCAILLLVIVLQITRWVQKCRKKPLEYPTIMLTLATAFVLSWIMGFFNLLLVDFLRLYHPFFMIISAIAIFSSSVVNLTLLYNLDKDFQACLLQVLRCSKNRYEDAISEADITVNSTNDEYSVAFHNPTEELLTNAY